MKEKLQQIGQSLRSRNLIGKILYLPRIILLFLIMLYQVTLSPDHGFLRYFFPHGYCRFHPSCSNYSFSAVEKYGVFVGLVKTIWRIIRCNPWNQGGDDPLK